MMACYNAEKTIRKAVQSILDQDYTAYEYIIVEDGSSDDSSRIVMNMAAKDSRIKVILNDSNMGLAASLNRGIKAARGKYILRMDADDVAMPGRIITQIKFMQENPAIDICGTGIIPIYEDGSEGAPHLLPSLHDQIVKRIFRKTLVFHPTIIIKRECYLTHGFYDPNLRWAEDADLWYRIYDRVTWHNIAKPLLRYKTKSRLNKKIIKYNLAVKYRGMERRGKLLTHGFILVLDALNYAYRWIRGR